MEARVLLLSEQRYLSSPLSITLNQWGLLKDSREEEMPEKNKMMEDAVRGVTDR